MEPWVQREARIFRGRTGTKLSQEDAAHEVRWAVNTCIDSFDPGRGAAFETFAGRRALGALRNAQADHIYDPLGRSRHSKQKRYRDTGSDLHFVEAQPVHLVTEEDPASTAFEQKEARDLAGEYLARLEAQSPRYAQVVRMTFGLDGYAEMDAREMGEALGISKETAQKVRQRAMKALGRLAGEA